MVWGQAPSHCPTNATPAWELVPGTLPCQCHRGMGTGSCSSPRECHHGVGTALSLCPSPQECHHLLGTALGTL